MRSQYRIGNGSYGMAAQNEGADVTKAKAISRAIDILPVIREGLSQSFLPQQIMLSAWVHPGSMGGC